MGQHTTVFDIKDCVSFRLDDKKIGFVITLYIRDGYTSYEVSWSDKTSSYHFDFELLAHKLEEDKDKNLGFCVKT